MKRGFSSIFLLLALGFLLVSNAKAGERENNLVMLAGAGDVNGVQNLLDQGVDVNAKSGLGNCTALESAIMFYGVVPGRNYMDVVQLLITRGADINAISCGGTPLTLATKLGRVDVVRVLIDKGADVNKKDDLGHTALMVANSALEKGDIKGLDDSLHPIYAPVSPEKKDALTNIVQMLQAAGAV